MSTLSKCACAGVASLALVAWLGAPGAARAEINYNTIALTDATGTSLGLGPNLGDGVNFSSFVAPALNAAGEVAFLGFLTGTAVDDSNNSGIWSNAGGTLTAVARSGSGGPGPNVEDDVYFSDFNVHVLNASGEVAFVGVLTGAGVDGTNDRGIWSNAGGTLAVVARKGSGGPGPNVGDGVYFSAFNNPVINTAGEVAFVGLLTGTGVDVTNDIGIWTNAGGTLVNIVRTGSLFDVDPTAGVDLRMISSIGFESASGGEDGRRLSFNDAGLLTFALTFTDGSSGIFTAQVSALPEPTAGAVMALAGLALLRRRK